jgi:proteasome accessory factor B
VSDQKTERLINLTLALLASKRFLTKNEIFSTVAGYSGSAETMERMFERDKDELRNLGIKIEVRGMDPLFGDDQGYLIQEESFQINSNEFTQEELLYLTMAANLWHGSALHNQSKAALLKIQSISGPIEVNDVNSPVIKDSEDSTTFLLILEAIRNLSKLRFEYKGSIRIVSPYGLYTQDGFWYLVAEDDVAIKTFKLIRINPNVEIVGKPNGFSKPENFELKKFLADSKSDTENNVVILVRKNQALALRRRYQTDEVNSEWDRMKFKYLMADELIESLLWFASDVVVLEPESIRAKLLANCKELIND